MVLFPAGKLRTFDLRYAYIYKLVAVIAPLVMALMVAVSRVSDYWHHWWDVLVGGLIGTFNELYDILLNIKGC